MAASSHVAAGLVSGAACIAVFVVIIVMTTINPVNLVYTVEPEVANLSSLSMRIKVDPGTPLADIMRTAAARNHSFRFSERNGLITSMSGIHSGESTLWVPMLREDMTDCSIGRTQDFRQYAPVNHEHVVIRLVSLAHLSALHGCVDGDLGDITVTLKVERSNDKVMSYTVTMAPLSLLDLLQLIEGENDDFWFGSNGGEVTEVSGDKTTRSRRWYIQVNGECVNDAIDEISLSNHDEIILFKRSIDSGCRL